MMNINNNTTAYTFWKSTLSGSVYRFPADMGIPAGNDWEAVHEATYIDHCKEHGLPY